MTKSPPYLGTKSAKKKCYSKESEKVPYGMDNVENNICDTHCVTKSKCVFCWLRFAHLLLYLSPSVSLLAVFETILMSKVFNKNESFINLYLRVCCYRRSVSPDSKSTDPRWSKFNFVSHDHITPLHLTPIFSFIIIIVIIFSITLMTITYKITFAL